jgi:(E)-4-hydroxy-3-methylbut-2-enyl-diphosphate synthase
VPCPHIREKLDRMGVNVPLVGDFHYNGHTLLNDHPACARGAGQIPHQPWQCRLPEKKDRNFSMMVETAMKFDRPVRIGVNWGSLDQSLLTELMDQNAKSADPKDVREVMHEAVSSPA